MIPRHFHWIWVGDKPYPEQYGEWAQQWLELHPGWTGTVWTDANRPELINEREFLQGRSASQRADVLSYELVLRFGGVYVDADFEPRKNIERLVHDVQAFTAEEEPGQIAVGIFGATPGHPWMQDVVDSVPDSFASRPTIPEQTGPGLVHRHTVGRTDVRVFPPPVFYPYGWGEPERADEDFPDAFAVHRWHHSWAEDEVREQRNRQEALEVEILKALPVGSSVVVIDGGSPLDLGSELDVSRYNERDGVYWGGPADSEDARKILEAVHPRSDWLVVLDSAFWWREYYKDFFDALSAGGTEPVVAPRFWLYRLGHRAPGAVGSAGDS